MELQLGTEGFELVHPNGNWLLKKEVGFSPIEALVASIGSCSAYVYQKILTNSKIEHTFQKVSIDYERSVNIFTHPLSRVEISFYLHVSDKEKSKAERATKLIARNCPVIQSLDKAIEVCESVIFV